MLPGHFLVERQTDVMYAAHLTMQLQTLEGCWPTCAYVTVHQALALQGMRAMQLLA